MRSFPSPSSLTPQTTPRSAASANSVRSLWTLAVVVGVVVVLSLSEPASADCVVGEWNSSSSDPPFTCDRCEAGYFSDSTTATVCTRCLAGTFQNGRGKSECKVCSGGEYSAADAATECLECQAGFKAKNSGSSECTACAPGQYQDQAKKTKCSACLNGQFVAVASATVCIACEDGQYGAGQGATECQLCAQCDTDQYINGTCTNAGSSTANCLHCVSTCADGEYLAEDPCDGRGNNDPRLEGGCVTCTASNGCPTGQYGFTRNACNGSFTVDGVACRDCRSCPSGKYESTSCTAGSTTDVTTCTACANSLGTCDKHEYLTDSCNGTTTTDVSECTACAHSSCDAGQYLHACSGAGETDDSSCGNCSVCEADQFPTGTACDGTGSSDTVQCRLCSLYCTKNATGDYDVFATDGRACVYHCPAQDPTDAALQAKAILFSTDLVDTLEVAPYNFDANFDITSFSISEFSNELTLMLTTAFYNERDFYSNGRGDAVVAAIAGLLNVQASAVSLQTFVGDIGVQAALRANLLHAGKLPTVASVLSCETAGFGAQAVFSDLGTYCADSCYDTGDTCVAFSVNTTTDECCTYDSYDDSAVAQAGLQSSFDTFFYSLEQGGACFTPSGPSYHQKCPKREYYLDGVLQVDHYSHYIMYNSGLEQLTGEEFLCVSHDAATPAWSYYDQMDSSWVPFIPQRSSDVLLGQVDFAYGEVVGLFNSDGRLDGLPYGYVANDLVFNSTVSAVSGTPLVSWGADATYFCTLSSATLSRRRRLTGGQGRRSLEGAADSALVGVTIELGLCDTHEYQWLGSCFACSLTSCPEGSFLRPCDGLSTYDSSECVSCTSSDSCNATEFLHGTCDGDSTIDERQCRSCNLCVNGMVTSDGEPCEEACDADPAYTNCPAEVRIVSDPEENYPESTGQGTAYWPTIVAEDAEDGTLAAVASASNNGLVSGSVFPAGSTPLLYSVTDSMGTVVNCSFNVVVVPAATRCNLGAYWDAEQQTCALCATPGACSAGEFYDAYKRCQGFELSDDSCQPCGTSGNCPAGSFFSRTCDGTTTFDSACVECTSVGDCGSGFYHNASAALCDGTGVVDERCIECTTSGNCPAGTYFDSSVCDGTGSIDACLPCTTSGSCPAGQYFDATACDGTGTIDDACTTCAAWSTTRRDWLPPSKARCGAGFFLNASGCPGTGTEDDSCVACTANGACDAGSYYDSRSCNGAGESDNSCQPCTSIGDCPYGRFFNATSCDGSSAIDDSCSKCTLAGECPAGTYHNRSACAGDTATDSSCQACAADCSPGYYHRGALNSCDGTTRYDDSCTHCTRKGQCTPGQYWNSTTCSGNDATMDACFDCVKEGSCPVGYYYDVGGCNGRGMDPMDSCILCSTECPVGSYLNTSAGCQGDGTEDDVCISCTAYGNCDPGFYFNSTACDSGTAVADSCIACATSVADCPAGTFFNAGGCSGKGRSDNACQPCCSGGEFHDGVSTCDGSSGCAQCTFTAGNTCGAGFYHNLGGCDGTTTADNECLACRATADDCAAGFFLQPACTGTETTDVANCTACEACICGTDGMYYYDSAFCGGNSSGCLRARGCHNNCNGHGICDASVGTCSCFDGWGSNNDVAVYKAPDCSQRVCPSASAWYDLATNNITAHGVTMECSGRGICDRTNGECVCQAPFAGAACQATSCMAKTTDSLNGGRSVSCSGHGRCLPMADLALEANALPLVEPMAGYQASFDSERLFGCVCDSLWPVGLGEGEVQEAEWFGPDCALRHCPTGNNLETPHDETNCTGVNGGTLGNLCLVECAGQGECNHATGECLCREGFGGINCATRVLVTERQRKGWGGVVPGHEAGGGRVRAPLVDECTV